MNGRLLVRALRDPDSLGPDTDWSGLVSAARAEQLAGSLAMRKEGRAVPPRVAAMFESARREAAYARTQALWEAEMARRALAGLDVPMILLKGTAFHAAGYDACAGRSVGDLDILAGSEFSRLTSIEETPGQPDAMEMVRLLVVGHEAVARTARSAFPAAEKGGDESTVDLLTQRLQVHEKTAWMLRSLLK